MKQIGRCLIYYADNQLKYLQIFMRQCVKPERRSCPKMETLLRGANSFDLLCFLNASLLCISKAKTVRRTLLQTDNFFQSSDKNVNCLTRTQIKILGIFEKQRIELNIFVSFLKKTLFLKP